ncbi:RNA-binding protein [Salininema proteolyticum]|uniref:RNA-binding protein n=1 Tax=Salininema proteolyticum TaxID=1607685 RepID=A0ABV8U0D9_9ACTN
MEEYYWPDWGAYQDREQDAREAWPNMVTALPVGTDVAGEVIGRQPFGVFLRLEGHPQAIGLAQITAMPTCRCFSVCHGLEGGDVTVFEVLCS